MFLEKTSPSDTPPQVQGDRPGIELELLLCEASLSNGKDYLPRRMEVLYLLLLNVCNISAKDKYIFIWKGDQYQRLTHIQGVKLHRIDLSNIHSRRTSRMDWFNYRSVVMFRMLNLLFRWMWRTISCYLLRCSIILQLIHAWWCTYLS
jgi:hypothetical protein